MPRVPSCRVLQSQRCVCVCACVTHSIPLWQPHKGPLNTPDKHACIKVTFANPQTSSEYFFVSVFFFFFFWILWGSRLTFGAAGFFSSSSGAVHVSLMVLHRRPMSEWERRPPYSRHTPLVGSSRQLLCRVLAPERAAAQPSLTLISSFPIRFHVGDVKKVRTVHYQILKPSVKLVVSRETCRNQRRLQLGSRMPNKPPYNQYIAGLHMTCYVGRLHIKLTI